MAQHDAASNVEELAARLELRPLGPVEAAPPTLSFDRARSISLPWIELADISGTTEQRSMVKAAEAVREYFESSWGYAAGELKPSDVEHILKDGRVVDAHWVDPTSEEGKPFAKFVPDEGYGPFKPLAADDDAEDAALDENGDYRHGVFARHESGRVYRLLTETPLSTESFRTKSKYESAWESVMGMELVIDESDDGEAADLQTATEFIDLRAGFIETRYRELIVQRDLASLVVNAAWDMFNDGLLTSVGSPAALEDLKRPYVSASLELESIERGLRTLVRQASEMGFVLYVAPAPVADSAGKILPRSAGGKITVETVGDDGKTTVTAGDKEFGVLYRRKVEKRSYTPVITVFDIVGWLFPRRTRRRIRLPTVRWTVTVHVKVDTTQQPHLELAAELAANSDDPKDVHICELRHNGYVTDTGMPLELLMAQCALDERVRRRTAVFIPSYEYRLTGERVVTGYSVFIRPAPGSSPVAFPELEVVETLEYKTAWIQAEVGELAKSINLAPGETRQITVTRSFEQETTETKTSSSVFDLASSESTDLATEMERTVRNESNVTDSSSRSSTKSASASASASGSYFGVSGSASASASATGTSSASRDKSLKSVGSDMAKAAQKAARSVNEQRREEVSSTSTSKTTIATSDTSVSTIENINQGRSLNLMFYRLYNRFEGKLFLRNLKLNVRSGSEIIAGSGIFSERSYPIHELDSVITELARTPLPLDLDDAQEWELKLRILKAVGELVLDEYDDLSEAEEAVVSFGDDLTDVVGEIAERAFAAPAAAANMKGDAGPVSQAVERDYRDKLADLTGQLSPMTVHGVPVDRTEILVAAQGLFLDSHVGMRPSTEPYSERMRDAEVAMRYAEIDRVHSESSRNRALAVHMGADELGPQHNAIMDISVDGKIMQITLAQPLQAGDWRLENNERASAGSTNATVGSTVITHQFGSRVPGWAKDGNFAAVELVETERRDRIRLSEIVATK